jgi:hypothetical protein
MFEDPTAPLGLHVGQHELHEVQHGADARLERLRDRALVELHERAVRAVRRVVDEDVDRAQRLARLGHEALARRVIEDVALDRDGAAAGFSIAATVSRSVPGTPSDDASRLRATAATHAPSAASRCAIPAPMPRLAPVTIATLPSHSAAMFRVPPHTSICTSSAR